MLSVSVYRIVLCAVIVLLFIPPQCATAQLAYSAFVEGSQARLGLPGWQMNFAAANPAVLGDFLPGSHYAFILETTHDNVKPDFEDQAPDFAIGLGLTPRLAFALARTSRSAFSSAQARLIGRDIDVLRHPLNTLFYEYHQDWSAGLGFRFPSNLEAGLAMRHEDYVIFPLSVGSFRLPQSFQTFDLGVKKSIPRLNFGLVLRNFLRNRTTSPFSRPITIVVNGDTTITWHPAQFPGIAFEPKFALEGGVHWRASSHWQFLGDLTSRKEYALGLRWRVFSQFFVTAGTGKRFDRIYAKAPAIYRTLGGQFIHERFALGVTWVIPLHAENDPFLATPYGHYDLRQITHHVLLISGAFSL